MDALKSFVEKEVSGNNQQQNNNNEGGNNNNNNSGGASGASGLLGSLSSLAGGNNNNSSNGEGKSEGGLLGSLNTLAGGGKDSEKNEDYLDKGVDAFQQYVLKQGDQSNESAVEQAKDEQISDFIRTQYKNTTGKDFFVKDKDTNLGL